MWPGKWLTRKAEASDNPGLIFNCLDDKTRQVKFKVHWQGEYAAISYVIMSVIKAQRSEEEITKRSQREGYVLEATSVKIIVGREKKWRCSGKGKG